MSNQGTSKPPQYDPREDPNSGIQWRVIQEEGSILTLKSLHSENMRTISYGTWITWPRVRAKS